MNADAVARITATPLGTRVVVRSRTPDGYSDALGYLRALDETSCTIETRRRGLVTVALESVVRAKTVPQTPAWER